MGMDVMGVNPKSEVGQYFQNSVWGWRPLADYCLTIAPEVCAKLTSHDHPEDCDGVDPADLWHTNDGCGLDADGSQELAAILIQEISNGNTANYQRTNARELANIPDECCRGCSGVGTVTREVAVAVGTEEVSADCGMCKGTGMCRPFVTNYPFSAANVAEFAAFLEDCGGFQIC